MAKLLQIVIMGIEKADLDNNGIVFEPSRECCLPDICIIILVNERPKRKTERGRERASQC